MGHVDQVQSAVHAALLVRHPGGRQVAAVAGREQRPLLGPAHLNVKVKVVQCMMYKVYTKLLKLPEPPGYTRSCPDDRECGRPCIKEGHITEIKFQDWLQSQV